MQTIMNGRFSGREKAGGRTAVRLDCYVVIKTTFPRIYATNRHKNPFSVSKNGTSSKVNIPTRALAQWMI
jgi:hypothetical protein